MRLRRYLAVPLAAALLVATACGGDDDSGTDPASKESSQESSAQESQGGAAASEPDLEGIPDVVAEVNGEELGKDEFVDNYEAQFQQMSVQAQSSGQPVDQEQLKKQVVDNMVNGELLVQEAESRGFEASQQQTDQALRELAQQNGLKSSEQFVAALEKQGMDQATVEEQVSEQVKIDQLLADSGSGAEPSDQELRAFYADLEKQQQQAGQGGQKLPPFAKVKSQLAEQVKSQQQSQVAGSLIEKLRKGADIKIHV